MDLYHRSIDIIKENQAASGAYVASPSFPTYHYCWLRDGSYIAYAMDSVIIAVILILGFCFIITSPFFFYRLGCFDFLTEKVQRQTLKNCVVCDILGRRRL